MNLVGPIYLVNFENAILELQDAMMFIAYFILLTGLIVRIAKLSDGNADVVAMTKPVFTCFFIVAIISTSSYWVEKLDYGFYGLAEHINENFGSEPFEVTKALMDTVAEDPEADGWGVDRIVQSIYLSVVYGLSKFFIVLIALIQVPVYLMQFILKWLGVLFLPIGLALFIFPSLSSIGVRLISNILAVMAWPVGFAITNLAAMGFVNDFGTAATYSGNTTGEALYMMSFGSLVMGLIAALILVIGTIATPTVMFILFSSGAGLQGLTGVASGTAMFATYLVGGVAKGAGGGKGNTSGSTKGGKESKGGPASTSGYGGIGPSGGGSQASESPAAYGSASSIVGPLKHYQIPSQKSLTGQGQQSLPSSRSPNNPLLPSSPNDPSGDRKAAQLFALGAATKPVIDI